MSRYQQVRTNQVRWRKLRAFQEVSKPSSDENAKRRPIRSNEIVKRRSDRKISKPMKLAEWRTGNNKYVPSKHD